MANEDLTIKFRTQGAKLILVSAAPLASGAINALYVEVEFDESWDDFPARTVNFYKSYTTRSAMIPSGTNVATIPHEITDYFVPEELGHYDPNCWINVSGVGDHKHITTNRVHTPIAIGGDGEAEADPTPTLYAQLLNAIDSGGIVAVSSVNGKTGAVVLSTDDIPEGAHNKYATEDILVQSDWDEEDETSMAFIKNKPKTFELDYFTVVDGQLCMNFEG